MATIEIISPLPGVFYRRPAPDSDVLANEGDQVESTTVIGIIEVMKQFSDLTAEKKGTLIRFCIEDSESVEPGQVIALVDSKE
ncbi:acetyl-CoA carboxylase [Idiomarina abyssalis]|uniref:acetyl-CoA carboxylase n=1 Tax=Idiomarina abyssalis TaxID=86102 RepID=UPI003A8D8ECE